jgi:hypothetical protein
MKYQFTTEGSKSQTKYHHIRISQYDDNATYSQYECVVSTPLTADTLINFLRELFDAKCASLGVNDLEIGLLETYPTNPTIKTLRFGVLPTIGLDSICRIISNIKPLKQKVVISICGERKTYELDADKLETLLKSLE